MRVMQCITLYKKLCKKILDLKKLLEDCVLLLVSFGRSLKGLKALMCLKSTKTVDDLLLLFLTSTRQ